jgi:hypothetical protein
MTGNSVPNADTDDCRRVRCTHRYPPTPTDDWDHSCFADEQEYSGQRLKLQLEIEQATPVPDDESQRAADMLESFGVYWVNLEGDEKGHHEMVEVKYVKSIL